MRFPFFGPVIHLSSESLRPHSRASQVSTRRLRLRRLRTASPTDEGSLGETQSPEHGSAGGSRGGRRTQAHRVQQAQRDALPVAHGDHDLLVVEGPHAHGRAAQALPGARSRPAYSSEGNPEIGGSPKLMPRSRGSTPDFCVRLDPFGIFG